jgi:hypothetical protein
MATETFKCKYDTLYGRSINFLGNRTTKATKLL